MSTYTPSLGLELITPGSQAGLWGNTTNNSLNLIDQAITGVTPIDFASASGSTHTLTDYNGAEDEARAAVLNITGIAIGANTVVIPNKQKTYLVRNNTGQDVTFQTPTPSATYSVGAGYSILIFCDGNNNVFTGIASPGVGTLPVNAGGTGATTFGSGGFIKSSGTTNALTAASAVNLASEVSGALAVTNGGTGATSLTSGALLVGNGTGTVASLSGGVAGYVATWNGSTWVAAAPASAGVTSVFGRTGVVTAQSTDYSAYYGSLSGNQTWSGTNTFTGTFALGGSGTTISGDGSAQISLNVGGSQRVQVYSTQTAFNTPINVTGYGSTFTAGSGGGSGALAMYLYGQREGQISMYYAANGSYGWHIGEEGTAGGGAFVVYPNASGIGGTYITYNSTVWQSRSDRRIKKDLEIIPNALDKIDRINGYTGKFIGDDTNTSRSFLVAQEVQEVLPEAVSASPKRDLDGDGVPDDLLGLAYTDVIPLLVQAVKELKAEVAALKAAK